MAENITSDKLIDHLQNSSSSTAPVLKAFKVAVITTIDIAALIGNVMVCLSMLKNPRLRSKTGYLILALAVTDFASALFVIPLTAGSLLLAQDGTPRWITNDVSGPLCQFQGILLYSLTGVSLMIMALAAITRYLCVVRPRLYRKYVTVKAIGISVLLLCVASLGLEAVMLIPGYARFRFLDSFSACVMVADESFSQLNKAMERAVLVLGIGIPLSVIVICHTAIYYTVRRHNCRIGNTLQESRSPNLNLEQKKDQEHSSDKVKLEKELEDKRNPDQAAITENSWKTQDHSSDIPSVMHLEEIQHRTSGGKMPSSHARSDMRARREESEIACDRQDKRKGSNNGHDFEVILEHMYPIHERKGGKVQIDFRDNESQGLEHTRQKGREIPTVDLGIKEQEFTTERCKRARQNHQKRRENSLSGCHVDKNTTTRLKQNRNDAKITRTILAVFLGFLVCWIPILTITAIKQSLTNSLSPSWFLTITYFAALSSAINPFIYATTIRDFRRTYVSLIKCDKTELSKI